MVDTQRITDTVHKYFEFSTFDGRPLYDFDIEEDGSVNVGGDVSMVSAPPGGQIPVRFYIVDGDFLAHGVGLTSLHNAPDSCHNLVVPMNQLTSLDGCPPYLNTLDVSNNRLTSFVGGPDQVSTIKALNNPLTSLNGLPDASDEWSIEITYNEKLPLLKLLNAKEVLVAAPGYNHLKPVEPVNSIINRYLGQGNKGVLLAAAELIKAGFRDNARL